MEKTFAEKLFELNIEMVPKAEDVLIYMPKAEGIVAKWIIRKSCRNFGYSNSNVKFGKKDYKSNKPIFVV